MTRLHLLGDALPPLPPPARSRDDAAALALWLRGWDACAAWLWPQLDRANRDADLWYERANNTPTALAEIRQRRLDAHFEQEWERFSTAHHNTAPAPAGHHERH
ncbi:hypothetical protein [Agromyces humatus]|uniref:Uncharacterized protein n=1 Tax=Agromyces humatus TaxID=279573 RepID=A0ABN2KYT2_9MICO|nr:hypothetical protein [Agromyces humatus]